MQTKVMKMLLKQCQDDDQMAVIWFDQDDANDMLTENSLEDMTQKEWDEIALAFSRDKYLSQVADEVFNELIYKFINQKKEAQK